MKTLDYIQLDTKKVENVVTGLQHLLADFQVYYTNLRGFHWNIKGKSFFVLHSQFEKMYDDTAEKVDEIAERVLPLGGVPSQSGYVDRADEALKNILETLSYIISKERQLLSAASEAGDEVTVSLMSDYLKEQEKLVWMLSAYKS